MSEKKCLKRIRILLGGFIVGIVLSGITAFPLTSEVGLLLNWFGQGDGPLAVWLRTVHAGLVSNDKNFPFIAYGTDWLAFGHLVIAIAFYGPYRDPVRNRWVIDFGMIACATVPILAFVAGPIRGIPIWWRVIDSLFGIIGIIPLWFIRRDIDALEVAKPYSS
jgi:hypothetical protein